MQRSLGHNFVCGTIAIALLSACSGSGSESGVPDAASSLAAAQSPFGQKAGGIGLSGEYVEKSMIRATARRGSRCFCRNLKTRLAASCSTADRAPS